MVNARPLSRLGLILGRSLFPFIAVGILLGTMWWGPWLSLIFALVWWRVVSHVG